MVSGWPFGAVVEVLRTLPRTPPADRPAGMAGWFKRAGHMLARALVDNVPPGEYLAYRLHDPARRGWIDACLYLPESLHLLPHLNRLNGADTEDAQDKARFAVLCRRHGLPCIPTLAVFRDGGQLWPDTPFSPDQPWLWVKDLAGSRGAGAACWRLDAGRYRNVFDETVRTPDELVATWRRRDSLVQPRLENHPVLASVSDGELADFRVVTGIGRDGTVAIVAALAQLPHGGAGTGGVIFAPMEESGRLASPMLGGFQPVERHPDTSMVIADIVVPHWREALDLVVRAHRDVPEFARFVFLGWDVAITADGPVLIETNSGWGAFNHQVSGGPPLGWTAFPAIALQHLEGLDPCG